MFNNKLTLSGYAFTFNKLIISDFENRVDDTPRTQPGQNVNNRNKFMTCTLQQ